MIPFIEKFNIIKLFLTKPESEDDRRSLVIKRNIFLSLIAKFFNLLIGFITVPLVLNYLDKYNFGIYSTLTSILLWIDLFDIGLGQGLRNKLTIAYTEKNIELCKKYISTTYAILIIISFSLIIFFYISGFFISWNKILNVDKIPSNELNLLAGIVFTSFSIRFVTSIINKIYFAMHKSSWIDITQVLGKIFYIVAIIILVKFTKPSLLYFGSIQSIISFMVPLVASIFFFRYRHKELTPSFRYIDFRYFKSLMNLGIKFFIIQISLLFIYSANNLLISQFVNPAEVTNYQISYTLFSYFIVVFSIINTPLWSAYTEAWKLERTEWINNTIKRTAIIYFLLLIMGIIVLFFSPLVFRLWIGNNIRIPFIITVFVFIMIFTNMWISVFDSFINGIGKIKLQMILSIIAAIINIPIAYILTVKFGFGTIGIVISSILCFSLTAVSSPIQTYLILNNKAKGIFNK